MVTKKTNTNTKTKTKKPSGKKVESLADLPPADAPPPIQVKDIQQALQIINEALTRGAFNLDDIEQITPVTAKLKTFVAYYTDTPPTDENEKEGD